MAKRGGDAQETITASTHSNEHFKWKQSKREAFWKRFYGKYSLGKYSKRFSNHFTYTRIFFLFVTLLNLSSSNLISINKLWCWWWCWWWWWRCLYWSLHDSMIIIVETNFNQIFDLLYEFLDICMTNETTILPFWNEIKCSLSTTLTYAHLYH